MERRDSIPTLTKIPEPTLPKEYSEIPNMAKSDNVTTAPKLIAVRVVEKARDLERKNIIDKPR
jgi:hypothetical protein